MFKEFKEFAMKGNVVDMAVGLIIGAGFGKIVNSFVNDLLMPPLGLLMGKVDFSQMFVNLSGTDYPSLAKAKEAGAATINYGLFINTVMDFILVALAVFLLVKQINKMKKPAAAAAPTTKECPYCLSQIPLRASRCAHCTEEIKSAA